VFANTASDELKTGILLGDAEKPVEVLRDHVKRGSFDKFGRVLAPDG
jgi:hypothetical protein